MSNLSPLQFGAYTPPEPSRTDTYPVWGEDSPGRIVVGRLAATHKARQRIKGAKPISVIGQGK